MKEVLSQAKRLVDIDWKVSIVTDAVHKAENNKIKIQVKVVLEDSDKEQEVKYMEFSPVEFFEFYKNVNDCKNLIDMTV